MSVQTTVSNKFPIGVPGMLAESENNAIQTETRRLTADANPGQYVVFSGQDDAAPPTSAAAVTGGLGGIILLNHGTKPSGGSVPFNGTVSGGHKSGDLVTVLTLGRVFVPVEDTVSSVPAAPYVRYANTGNAGDFRAASSTGANASPPGVQFKRLSGDGVAVVEINHLGVAAGPVGPTGATGPTGPTGPTGE